MTEVEAQKFIARWTPSRHRCEVTRAKLRRIRGQFWIVFFNGAFVFLVPFLKLSRLKTDSELFHLLRIVMVVLGIANMCFALVMMWQLDRVRRALNRQQAATALDRRPRRIRPSPAMQQQTEIVNG